MRTNQTPLLSVIISTYNRSNILHFTIQTVLDQTYKNFEIIVIGDHCTDDTEQVLQSFNDERISFHNLPENFGEQSYPNNIGFQKSRGDYIAWLNHDDLWFNDHLDVLLNAMGDTGADLVYSWNFSIRPGQFAQDRNLPVYTHPNRYIPFLFVPASTWLVKRTAVEKTGLWKSAGKLHVIPSFDWINRLFERGLLIIPVPKLTVIILHSGYRKNSYLERQFTEHKAIFSKLGMPGYREELLTELASILAFRRNHVTLKAYLLYLVKKPCLGLFLYLNYNFIKPYFKLRYRKGEYLRKLRKIRGLPSENKFDQ